MNSRHLYLETHNSFSHADEIILDEATSLNYVLI